MESQPRAGKVADSVISLPHDLRLTLGSFEWNLDYIGVSMNSNVTKHIAALESPRMTLALHPRAAGSYLWWFPSGVACCPPVRTGLES